MGIYKLTFSENDMQVLQAALVELPFRVAAPLIDKINAQIKAADVQEQYDGNEAVALAARQAEIEAMAH